MLCSVLTEREKCYVIDLANTSHSFPQVGQILRGLYHKGRTQESVQDDEEESVDWGDVAEDSSDRDPAGGLQALLAGSPENLMDND